MEQELNLIIRLRDEATSELKKFTGNLQGVGTVALAAGAAAGAALAGVGVAGVVAFAKFEDQMNEVFTLMPGMTEDAMSAMSESVKQFSTDFGTLPNEVIPALYQSISAGVPPDNVFDFLTTAQKAAVGGVTELEVAVDGISSVVNAYGSDVLDATQASDLMFTAVKLGKTDFDQLSRSLFQVTPIASSLGVEFGDVTAALAVMTAQGVPTRVATTQLRQAFVELSKDGSKTATLFQELSGQSFKDFIAGGGDVQQALQLLEAHAADTGVGINDLFGSVEAGAAALLLTGGSTEAFTNALNEMDSAAGATDTAYDQMATGLTRSWERIVATATVALINIGEHLAPTVAAFATAFEERIPQILEFVGGVLSSIMPILAALGEAFSTFVTAILDGGSPIEALVNLVVGLALQFGLARENVGTLVDVIRGLGGTFTEVAGPILEMVTSFVSWQDILMAVGIAIASVIIPLVISFVASIAPLVLAFLAVVAVVAVVRAAFEGELPQLIAKVQEVFGQIVAYVTDNLPVWIETLKHWARVAWQWLQEAIPPLLEKAGELIATLFAWVQAQLPGLIEMFKAWGTAAWQWLSEVVPPLLEKAGELIAALVAWVQAQLPGLIEMFKAWGTAAWQWLAEVIPPLLVKAGEMIGALLSWVQAQLPGWIETLKSWGTAAWQWLAEVVPPVLEKAGELIAALLAWVQANLPGWIETLKAWGTKAWEWLQEAVPPLLARAGEMIGALLGFLAANLPGWIAKLYDWMIALVQWIGEAIPPMLVKAGEFLGKLIEWAIGTALPAIVSTMVTWAKALYAWITDVLIPEIAPRLATFKETLIETLRNMIAGIKSAAGEIGTGIVNGIIDYISAGAGRLADIVRGTLNDAIDAAKRFLGISSPSKLTRRIIGQPIMQGVGLGIEEATATVAQTLRLSLNQIINQPTPAFDARGLSFASAGGFVAPHVPAPARAEESVAILEVKVDLDLTVNGDVGTDVSREIERAVRNAVDAAMREAGRRGDIRLRSNG